MPAFISAIALASTRDWMNDNSRAINILVCLVFIGLIVS